MTPSEAETTLQALLAEETVTDLLVRYWGVGKRLNDVETQTLLSALDEENKFLRGPIHVRGLMRLKEKGIQ